MSSPSCFRFLRPSSQRIHRNLSAPKRAAYLHFYAAARSFNESPHPWSRNISYDIGHVEVKSITAKDGPLQDTVFDTDFKSRREDIRRRVEELQNAKGLKYPRIRGDARATSCAEFKNSYESLKAGELRDAEIVTLRGRLYSSRIAGSKLAFMDIVQDGHRVQGVCDFGRLEAIGIHANDFKDFCRLTRRGDIISITGIPSRTKRGELSVIATQLPTILTPTLASLPTTLEEPETRVRNRHVDLLVNQSVADTLRLRSRIIQYLRNFLVTDNFLEVQTPILADGAGGAIARPFATTSTEFSNKTLSLRIAPEIWLKRLVLGGMDRIFEIGPAFRNEGLDATHNPEFTTCEFYKAFADLEDLITITESMISGLARHVNYLIQTQYTTLSALEASQFTRPFKRIEFVPALEGAIGRKLPDLQSHSASEHLVSLFHDLSIALPTSLTLPRLLDRLSSHYLEPQCSGPTFIIHAPACLAPLAKSFHDPATNQIVSARVELFIQSKEIANMYEEENSPFEQRRKFIEQAQWRDDENRAVIDEGYLEALEWGLPPTGGWGCGVDRLCMLFAGASRINDVLSFGNLRNVVSLAQKT